MDPLIDHQAADAAVTASLLRATHDLWKELEIKTLMLELVQQSNKRSYPMSKVLQDVNGALYVVHKYEMLGVEEAKRLLETLKNDASQLESFIAAKVDAVVDNQPSVDAAPVEQPVAPVQPEAVAAPVEQAAPAVLEQPAAAPALDLSAQPAAPVAPVETVTAPVDVQVTPAQPATPAVDPNEAPVLQ